MVWAALVVAAAMVDPGRWVPIGEDGTHAHWYVDAYSMPDARGTSSAPWFKMTNEDAGITERLFQIGVRCESREIATLQAVTRYANGKSQDMAIDSTAYEQPAPDSMGEGILRLVCSK